jgi:hypothetical protein
VSYTGGSITDVGGYKIIRFTGSGSVTW